MNVEASKYLAAIGRRGGKAKSAAKTAAARKANAARWRNHKPKRVTATPNAETKAWRGEKHAKQKYDN